MLGIIFVVCCALIYCFVLPALDSIQTGDTLLKGFTLFARIVYFIAFVAFIVSAIMAVAMIQGA